MKKENRKRFFKKCDSERRYGKKKVVRREDEEKVRLRMPGISAQRSDGARTMEQQIHETVRDAIFCPTVNLMNGEKAAVRKEKGEMVETILLLWNLLGFPISLYI